MQAGRQTGRHRNPKRIDRDGGIRLKGAAGTKLPCPANTAMLKQFVSTHRDDQSGEQNSDQTATASRGCFLSSPDSRGVLREDYEGLRHSRRTNMRTGLRSERWGPNGAPSFRKQNLGMPPDQCRIRSSSPSWDVLPCCFSPDVPEAMAHRDPDRTEPQTTRPLRADAKRFRNGLSLSVHPAAGRFELGNRWQFLNGPCAVCEDLTNKSRHTASVL